MAVERLPQQTTTPTISRSEYDRGRIRVSEFDAGEIYQALSLRVDQLIEIRGELVDTFGREPASLAEFYNRKISALRRALGEIERTAREKGWDEALAVIEAYIDAPTV